MPRKYKWKFLSECCVRCLKIQTKVGVGGLVPPRFLTAANRCVAGKRSGRWPWR